MAMITKFLSWSFLAITTLLGLYLLYPPLIPSSPLSGFSPREQPIVAQKSYLVLGFLPYWNLKKITDSARYGSTHIAYFALRLDSNGQLVTKMNPKEEEPGYTNYKRLLNDSSKLASHTILTFVQKDQDSLSNLLNSKSSRHTAVQTIVQTTQMLGGIGVNVDFEPLGTIPPLIRANFSSFMQELSIELKKNNLLSSISIYASAVSNPRLWDLTELSHYSDYFVVMTYDYTLPNNPKTGPNSPLRGAGTLFEHDIISNLAEITTQIPANKILLGIPFYGYEWDTTEVVKYAAADSRGSLASLERIQKLINDNTLELLWDRNSLTPYALRRVDGKVISQIYYEDINSIKLKLGLVKQAGLGGIAIWALGYEGDNPVLWQTIKQTLISP